MVECVVDILNELPIDARNQYNKACIYIEIAVLLFAKSNYEQVGTSVDLIPIAKRGCLHCSFLAHRHALVPGCELV